MRDSAQALARNIHKKAKQGKSFDASYKKIVLKTYDDCHMATCGETFRVSSENHENLLSKATVYAFEHVGLEKIFIREIANDKRYRRQEVVERVLKVQAACRARAQDSRDELMKLGSESITLTSRLFARRMGQA